MAVEVVYLTGIATNKHIYTHTFMKNWLEKNKQKGWFLWTTVLFGFFLFFLFVWWLGQPIKVIYDREAPAWHCDDDPEGGYFSRC